MIAEEISLTELNHRTKASPSTRTAPKARQTHVALNHLNACGNELRAFVQGGTLTSEQGEDLLQSLMWLIEDLQGRAAGRVLQDSEG